MSVLAVCFVCDCRFGDNRGEQSICENIHFQAMYSVCYCRQLSIHVNMHVFLRHCRSGDDRGERHRCKRASETQLLQRVLGDTDQQAHAARDHPLREDGLRGQAAAHVQAQDLAEGQPAAAAHAPQLLQPAGLLRRRARLRQDGADPVTPGATTGEDTAAATLTAPVPHDPPALIRQRGQL